MKILFLNHSKAKCGVYEIGKRIYSLLDKSVIDAEYHEIPTSDPSVYTALMENGPDIVFYNYYPSTMPYVNKQMLGNFAKTKHIGIIHDPLFPEFIEMYNRMFTAWIIHDDTNPIVSKNKFTTIRPIRRYSRKLPWSSDGAISIGTHGFSTCPWKMFDNIIKIVHDEFDEICINMNINEATFSEKQSPQLFDEWRKIIHKSGVHLNITNNYFETEEEVIDFLAQNTINIYFYQAHTPYLGVGGSADLAISAQSSLAVNATHMYRHIHSHLGFYEQYGNLRAFLNNAAKVREVYESWSPQRMTRDYKLILERI
jgi:hypothetical protein